MPNSSALGVPPETNCILPVIPENRLRWTGLTHCGKVRKNNEDAFLAVRLDRREVQLLGKLGEANLGSDQFIFAVSDGMGGAMAGEYASRITVEKITRMSPRWREMTPTQWVATSPKLLTELFAEIHRALCYLGNSYEECSGMEATLSLVWFFGTRMVFGHIGDSRIYRIPGNESQLQQMTNDDTHVGWLYRNRQINEREARTHPRRHILQKALGGQNQFVQPQVGLCDIAPGDRFLLCTDGIFDELYDKDILTILATSKGRLKTEAENLMSAVLQRDARDNATALVIGFESPPPEPARFMPQR